MQGILFKPEMIKAIVEGRKTVTRRVMQHQPTLMDKVYYKAFKKDYGGRKPRYQVGETVYIKEGLKRIPRFYVEYTGYHTEAVYASDNKFVDGINWVWKHDTLSPMFLPKACARYFIKIKDVRAERLQEITEADAVKEGTPINDFFPVNTARIAGLSTVDYYAALWDSINGEGDFALNKWVWRYQFELLRKEDS